MGECRYFPYFIVCYFGKEREGMIRMREPFPLEASSERPSPRLRAAPVVMPTSKDFRQGYTCRFIPVGHAAHEVFQVDPPHEFDAVTSSKGEAGVIGPCPRCHIIRAVTCHFSTWNEPRSSNWTGSPRASPTASPYTASRSVLIAPPGEYSFCIIVPEKEIADKADSFFGKGNKNRREAAEVILFTYDFRIISPIFLFSR